jgi:hypothetical protein
MGGRTSESGASHLAVAGAASGAERAPWSIQAVRTPISPVLSAAPPSGMRMVDGPPSRWISRLPPLFPGFTAAPLRPPLRTSAYVASDRPPDRFSAEWQTRHRVANTPWTCRV